MLTVVFSLLSSISPSIKQQMAGKQPCWNVDDTNSEEGHNGEVYDVERPWLSEWNRYEKMHKAVPDGMAIVHWWGVCPCVI